MSRAELVIGDPLMRITGGPPKTKSSLYQTGETNLDKIMTIADVYSISYFYGFYGGSLETFHEEDFQKYYDLCVVDQNDPFNAVDIIYWLFIYLCT